MKSSELIPGQVYTDNYGKEYLIVDNRPKWKASSNYSWKKNDPPFYCGGGSKVAVATSYKAYSGELHWSPVLITPAKLEEHVEDRKMRKEVEAARYNNRVAEAAEIKELKIAENLSFKEMLKDRFGVDVTVDSYSGDLRGDAWGVLKQVLQQV